MSYATVNVRHLESLDTIMGDVGNKVDVVNVKLSVFLALGINCAK